VPTLPKGGIRPRDRIIENQINSLRGVPGAAAVTENGYEPVAGRVFAVVSASKVRQHSQVTRNN